MGDFIELILGNPLLLLLIIGGLASLFSKKEKESEKQSQSSQRSEQTNSQSEPKRPSRFEDFMGKIEDALSDDEPEKRHKPQPSTTREASQPSLSADEKRMQQMQRLSDQIKDGTYETKDASDSRRLSKKNSRIQVDVEGNPNVDVLRTQVKKRLHKRKLMDSIIMSEVLGEPRSKKPYQRKNMNKHRLY